MVIVTDTTEFGDDSIAIAMLGSANPERVRMIVASPGNVWAEESVSHVRGLITKLRWRRQVICVGLSAVDYISRHDTRPLESDFGEIFYRGALGREFPIESTQEESFGERFDSIATGERPDLIVLAPGGAISRLLEARQGLAQRVGRVFLMGGAIDGKGNATERAEFNFWFDPQAAETLMASDLPITLLPLDVTRHLAYPKDFVGRLNDGLPESVHLRNCIVNRPSRPVCDEVLAAIVLEPSIVTRRRLMRLAVEIRPGLDYGAVKQLPDSAGRRSVDVIEQLDVAKLWRVVQRSVTRNGLENARRAP